MEYLVSRYVDATDPFAGQRKIDKILSEHYTESAKKELIKSRIKENGEYTLLGQLTVRLDQARDHYWADVPALGDNTVRVGPKILEQYREVLMTSGAWGTMVIEYDATYEIKSRKYPFMCANLPRSNIPGSTSTITSPSGRSLPRMSGSTSWCNRSGLIRRVSIAESKCSCSSAWFPSSRPITI